MKFWDLIRIANRNLFRNKLRTFLTVAAIFVGSFTLTMTNGIGDGMRDYVESQVKNVDGDAVIFVRKKIEQPEQGTRSDAPPEYKEAAADESVENIDPNAMLVSTAQMDHVLKDIEGVTAVTPRYSLNGEYITIGTGKKYKLQLGTLAEGISQKTEAGHGLTGPGQVVLPLGLARAFDPAIENLPDQTAKIAYRLRDGTLATTDLTISGVATKGFMTNNFTFVDTETAARIYSEQQNGAANSDKFLNFIVRLSSADPDMIAKAKSHLEDKGFVAETIADQRKRTYDAIGIFKIGMSLVALIALLAASFGIINTLVIAVLERTKEIGLQKALGMGRSKIFAIFSLESILIGFWGAVLGTVAGIVVGLIVNKVLVTAYAESFEGFSLFAFTLPSIASVLLLVTSVAFAAGVLPAFRASRLNPIDSLRYE